jgi:hypothetical protein
LQDTRDFAESNLDDVPEDDVEEEELLKITYSCLLAEQTYCLLHFYKYEKAEEAIKEASSHANLKMAYQGKMGRRTIY